MIIMILIIDMYYDCVCVLNYILYRLKKIGHAKIFMDVLN